MSEQMIDKILTVSTGNIKQSDSEFLSETETISVGNFEYGYFVFTYIGTPWPEFKRDFPKELSKECLAIYKYARKHGCRYICFDCDADCLPGFPTFKW